MISFRKYERAIRRTSRKSRCCFTVSFECGERLPASLQPASRHIAVMILQSHSLTFPFQNSESRRASRLTALLGLRQHAAAKHHLNGILTESKSPTTNGSPRHSHHHTPKSITTTHTSNTQDSADSQTCDHGNPPGVRLQSRCLNSFPHRSATRQEREGPLADVFKALNGVKWAWRRMRL